MYVQMQDHPPRGYMPHCAKKDLPLGEPARGNLSSTCPAKLRAVPGCDGATVNRTWITTNSWHYHLLMLKISVWILWFGFLFLVFFSLPWIFISIMLCSPCSSPALWCSPGYHRAAFFPVKEISGTFLLKLTLTLPWKCCPSCCRRQAPLGKMISLA